MPRKLSEDLMQKNEEYTKLKSDRPAEETPRETPDHQMPGYGGLSRPDLEAWTTEEIREMAETLEVSDAGSMSRDELVERLLAHEGDPSQRRGHLQ